jgi:2-polyprenyl-3-methyl-5-hydroxy-6-metoxy-1,4-benzoquinol methylase
MDATKFIAIQQMQHRLCPTHTDVYKMFSNLVAGMKRQGEQEGTPPQKRLKSMNGPAAAQLPSNNYPLGFYSHTAIHKTMVSDTPRMEAYAHAISKNRQIFKGKVVLDVGCGSGVLSM